MKANLVCFLIYTKDHFENSNHIWKTIIAFLWNTVIMYVVNVGNTTYIAYKMGSFDNWMKIQNLYSDIFILGYDY